jgi:uncharacterized protein
MDPRVSFVTLGVQDLARARAFYERLGLRASPASQGDVVFFQLDGGVVLALYPRALLAADACLPAGAPVGFGGFTLAHNVRTREGVARVLAEAERAGGRVLKPPQDTSWGGHHGYFADTEGHPWEVAWNPFIPLTADGGMALP